MVSPTCGQWMAESNSKEAKMLSQIYIMNKLAFARHLHG